MKERKRRGNGRYYFFFLFSLFAVIAAIYGAWYALCHVPIFEVRRVLFSGNTAIPDVLLQQSTSKYIGTNLFRVSKTQVKQDLAKFSRVKSVAVHKRLLNTLSIEINEREGLLYVKSYEGNLYPIDGDAIVLSMYGKVYREDIPIYSSYYTDKQFKPGVKLGKADLGKILALHKRIVKEAPEFLPIISEYYMIDNTINIIDARYGTRIIPSTENMAQQLKRYQFVQDNGNISRRSVVDLRFENQVVVKAGDK